MLNPDGYIGSDHHFRRFNDTNLSENFWMVRHVTLFSTFHYYSNHQMRKVWTWLIHFQYWWTSASNEVNRRVLCTLSEFYSVSPLVRMLSDFYTNYKNSRLLSLGGFSYSYIAYYIRLEPMNTFGVRVSAQSAFVAYKTLLCIISK